MAGVRGDRGALDNARPLIRRAVRQFSGSTSSTPAATHTPSARRPVAILIVNAIRKFTSDGRDPRGELIQG